MTEIRDYVSNLVESKFVEAAKKAGAVEDNVATIQKDSQLMIAHDEIEKLYKAMGETLPKYPAHATTRWGSFWEPYWQAGLIGADLKVKCMQTHYRYVDTRKLLSAEDFRVRLKKSDVHIDAEYFDFPEESVEIEKAMLANRNIFLSGPTGVGKTELFTRLLDKNKKIYERVNMDGDISKSDFAGDMWLIEGEKSGASVMVFNEGILPDCMRNGKVLLVDELDAAPQEVLFTLQSVLEGKGLFLAKKNERVMPAEGFHIIATANTVGKGDFTTMYTGVRLLNEATLDRFHYILRLWYPSKEKEIKILMKRTGIGEKWALQIAKLAESIRQMSMDRHVFTTFSIRKSLNFANALMDGVGPKFAYRATVLDRVSIEDAKKIDEIANRVIPVWDIPLW